MSIFLLDLDITSTNYKTSIVVAFLMQPTVWNTFEQVHKNKPKSAFIPSVKINKQNVVILWYSWWEKSKKIYLVLWTISSFVGPFWVSFMICKHVCTHTQIDVFSFVLACLIGVKVKGKVKTKITLNCNKLLLIRSNLRGSFTYYAKTSQALSVIFEKFYYFQVIQGNAMGNIICSMLLHELYFSMYMIGF